MPQAEPAPGPGRPGVRHTHHTGFTVSSLAEAKTFWMEVLGFEVLAEDAFEPCAFISQVTGVEGAAVRLAMLQGPGHIVELLEYTAPPTRAKIEARSCDVGAAHVAFFVDDLEVTAARARAHGWTALGAPQLVPGGPWAGTRVAYVRGPDGITLELMQPPPGGAVPGGRP